MLRRVITKTPGLQVVAEATDSAELSSLVDQCGAQWVVVSIWPEGFAPSMVQSLLLDRPTLSVLGMAADGSHAKIARTGSTEEIEEGLSLDDLIAIMKDVDE
jgi:hypothetical protein